MQLPKQVRVVEVGPRDGLQNEPAIIDLDIKQQLVERLASCGLSQIEAGSFVAPKWVPQMAGSAELFQRIGRQAQTRYTALVPNARGMADALASGVDEVAVFTAVTDAFCVKNINCTVAQSIERFQPIIEQAQQHNLKVRGYLSCTMGCPYAGTVATSDVVAVAQQLLAVGCSEIVISDTVGVGTAGQVTEVISAVAQKVPLDRLAVHFHDTYGQALANVLAALQVGISTVDSSVAGLGGCPYAKGAAGNLASEDLIYMLQGLGIETGVDLSQMVATGQWISAELGRNNQSRVGRASG